MSNIIALNLHERDADSRESRYAAKLADAIAEFKFQCRNDQEFFAERYDESLEIVEPKDDGLLDCMHRLIMNRVPGDDGRLLRELREQFNAHCQQMAEDYYEAYPIELED